MKPHAPSALALAMAEHMQRFSQRLGEPAALQALLHTHTLALMRAREQGHSCWPLAADAAAALQRSALVGTPAALASHPLLLDEQGRLALRRDFDHELTLAQHVARRLAQPLREVSAAAQAALNAAFELSPGDEPNAQHQAALAALSHRLALISGGPGTGKTTTVARLLGVLLQAHPQARVALAAPTGKAAARLGQALAQQQPALAARLPTGTVHRLLGAGPQGFSHGRDNPLALDWLVVDEASMLDLALARQLLDALPLQAHLVLVGDAGQLAAVEVGAVFAELCRAGLPGAVELQRSHRFGGSTALAALAQAVRSGQADAARALLAAPGDASVTHTESGDDTALLAAATALYAPLWAAAQSPHAEPAALLKEAARCRVLCATREGPRGAGSVNRLLLQHLRSLPGMRSSPGSLISPFCAGTPLLVLKNEPLLSLFNGDIGLVWPDAHGQLVAWFDRAEGPPQPLPLHRLPPHEAAFALTVHKAQGSEFEHTLVVLPAQGSPMLLREWLTTALTRARAHVHVLGEAQALLEAVNRPSPRHSGLPACLSEAGLQASGPSTRIE